MPSLHSVAAKLPSDARKQIAIQSLARRATISRLAVQKKVSRKFIYQQKHKADAALNQAFSSAEDASDVLFYLPVTAAWLNQLVLSLVLICHSSYRGLYNSWQHCSIPPSAWEPFITSWWIRQIKMPRSMVPRIFRPFKWGCWMKSFRETSRYWRVSMRLQRVAISCPKRNSATKQPGAYTCWMPGPKV